MTKKPVAPVYGSKREFADALIGYVQQNADLTAKANRHYAEDKERLDDDADKLIKSCKDMTRRGIRELHEEFEDSFVKAFDEHGMGPPKWSDLLQLGYIIDKQKKGAFAAWHFQGVGGFIEDEPNPDSPMQGVETYKGGHLLARAEMIHFPFDRFKYSGFAVLSKLTEHAHLNSHVFVWGHILAGLYDRYKTRVNSRNTRKRKFHT